MNMSQGRAQQQSLPDYPEEVLCHVELVNLTTHLPNRDVETISNMTPSMCDVEG